MEYFSASSKTNELSLTVHKAIACFIAAAHQIMLETLQGYKEEGHDGPQLLKHWHERMEPTGVRDDRNAFFTKVVEQANIVSHFIFFRMSALSISVAEIESGKL